MNGATGNTPVWDAASNQFRKHHPVGHRRGSGTEVALLFSTRRQLNNCNLNRSVDWSQKTISKLPHVSFGCSLMKCSSSFSSSSSSSSSSSAR